MKKLELKNLVFYSPYKLQLYGSSDIFELCGVVDYKTCEYEFNIHLKYNSTVLMGSSLEYSPILYPLSDYSNITEQGFIDLNCDIMDQIIIHDFANKKFPIDDIPYRVIQIMAKHHIDMFDLIPNNLAIKKERT